MSDRTSIYFLSLCFQLRKSVFSEHQNYKKGQQALHICAALRCTGLRKNRCPDGHPMLLPSSAQIPNLSYQSNPSTNQIPYQPSLPPIHQIPYTNQIHPAAQIPTTPQIPILQSNPYPLPVKILEKSLSGEINLIPLSGQSEGLAEAYWPLELNI